MSEDIYKLITSRNLGLINEDEQEILKNSKVAICGLGGIGSPVAENLVRMGIENFSILDHGTFEPTNSNRQIYSFTHTDGRWKTDVTEEYFHKIAQNKNIAWAAMAILGGMFHLVNHAVFKSFQRGGGDN